MTAMDRRLERLLDYWTERRGDRPMPARKDIDPARLGAELLPWIAITEVVDNARRFRFRLCGTGLAEFAGLDLTGRYIDELNPNKAYAEYILGLYRQVVTARRPVYSQTRYTSAGGRARTTARLICPLSADGAAVDMCIAAQVSPEGRDDSLPSLTFAQRFEPVTTVVL